MKKTIFLCLLLLCVSCMTNPDKGTVQEATSDGFTKTFKEYGFSVTSPCALEEEQVQGEIEADFLGIENPDDSVNATAYQVVVHKIPSRFEDFSEAQLNEYMDQMKASGLTNVEKVLFSDKYIGFVGDKYQNGAMNRMVMFNKGDYLITLMVGANTDLENKFKNFTDSFKAID